MLRVVNNKALALLMAGTLFVRTASAMPETGIAPENGFIENLQVALLVLGMLVFLIRVKRTSPACRCIMFGGAWLCLSFVLRELDVEDLAVPRWVIMIGSGTGRNLIMAAGWVAVGIFCLKSFRILKRNLKFLVSVPASILVVIGGFLLVSGGLFDRETIRLENGRLYEELLEACGYFLIFVAALMAGKFKTLPEDEQEAVAAEGACVHRSK
ncbi:hypothetical protein EGM51_16975 [Verrucomicrobia bacterium S94]|nr:hypothetical protein EGM51_16975 [Verrucomicrobia bacterium S94]